jgi:hypothetical protein
LPFALRAKAIDRKPHHAIITAIARAFFTIRQRDF